MSEQGVSVRLADGIAHYAGLGVCGRIWVCPVCSPKIRHQRAQELGLALASASALGMEVLFATLTLRHHKGQSLAHLLGQSELCWKALQQSRRYRRLTKSLGILGAIQVREITYGNTSGWHPHRHLAFVFSRKLTDSEVTAFEQQLWECWNHQLERRGLSSLRAYGTDVRRCHSERGLSWYLAKAEGLTGSVANEMARGDLKKGRHGHYSIEQLLDEFAATGDARLAALWQEYETATEGRRMFTWSQGLRQLLTLPEEELSDEEIAAAEVGGAPVVELDAAAWSVIRDASPGGIALLEAVEAGRDAAISYLKHTVPLRRGALWGVAKQWE